MSKAIGAEPTRLETTFWTNLVDAALSSLELVSVMVGTVTEPVKTGLFDGALELSIGSITVLSYLLVNDVCNPLTCDILNGLANVMKSCFSC